MSNDSNDFESVVEDILIISNGCKVTAETFGQTYNLITEGAHVIKIPNRPLESIVFRRNNGTFGVLADFVTNFRTLDGTPLGHVDTDVGKIPIPRFWPMNIVITKKYGLPRREGYKDILVDAFVVNNYWKNKLYNVVHDLPEYPSSGF